MSRWAARKRVPAALLFGSVQMNGAYQRRLVSVKTAFVVSMSNLHCAAVGPVEPIEDTAITSYGNAGSLQHR